MTTSITGRMPTHPHIQLHQPNLAMLDSSYERLAGAAFEPDLPSASKCREFDSPSASKSFEPDWPWVANEKKLRVRRDQPRSVVQGERIFTHHVNSEEDEPPENIEKLRLARYTSTAEAEAALDKLDGIVSFYAPYQAKAFLDHMTEFVEHASKRTRSVRISVSMGFNFTDVEGISWDAADMLVANRLKEALRERNRYIPVETRAIPQGVTKGVVILWEAFDGPASNSNMTQHSEL